MFYNLRNLFFKKWQLLCWALSVPDTCHHLVLLALDYNTLWERQYNP